MDRYLLPRCHLLPAYHRQETAGLHFTDRIFADPSTALLAIRTELQGLFSPALLSNIDKGVAMNPAERWQNAQEWINALKTTVAEPETPITIIQPQKVTPPQARLSRTEARRLLKVHDITPVEYDDKLEKCSGEGETELVRLLITAGADVNQVHSRSCAATEGHTECAKLLLATPGIDINKGNNDEWTPLARATALGQTECVKLLLTAPDIDVNKGNNDGGTPLNWAAREGHSECLKLLLDAPSIEVNSENNTGKTPLFLAKKNRHTECVNLLIEAGANDWDRQECESTEPAPKPIPRPTQQISSPPAPESEDNKGYGLILFYALGGAIIGGIIGAQIGNMGLGAIAGFFIGFIVATQLKD